MEAGWRGQFPRFGERGVQIKWRRRHIAGPVGKAAFEQGQKAGDIHQVTEPFTGTMFVRKFAQMKNDLSWRFHALVMPPC
jgi:hypothetical protein